MDFHGRKTKLLHSSKLAVTDFSLCCPAEISDFTALRQSRPDEYYGDQWISWEHFLGVQPEKDGADESGDSRELPF